MANYFGPLRGIMYDRGETKTFPTPRGEFKVRNIKVEFKETGRDGKEYSTIPELKLINDNCNIVDYAGYNVGKEVDVWFSINGKEMKWKDKVTGEDKAAWKTEITCLKLKAVVEDKIPVPEMTILAKDLRISAENQAMMNAAMVGGSISSNQLIDTQEDNSDLPF
jgi:hypothetical protein